MEMGFSGGLTESDTPSDSVVVGLKFGKKIYFEDTPPPPPPPPQVAVAPPPASNSRSLGRKGQQGCQIEGCKVDLSHSKSYYSKHRVCPLHSKTSMVIVSGLHQRFCQQCSRFHQLPEFDQGKRSCRRRLAGHNERRRKPPSGSFSPRYGGVPTIFDNSSSAGGFLVDFSTYAGSSTLGPGNQTAAAAVKFTPQVWQSNLQDPPPNLYSQGLAVGTDFAGSGSIPSGECFTGITVPDSSCALSLLSNQPWGSQNGASCLGMNNFLDAKDAPLAQPSTDRRGTIANQYANPWSFKGNEAPSSPHQIRPDLCLGQISHPFIGQLSGESELSHQNKTQYMEAEHPMAYHWSP